MPTGLQHLQDIATFLLPVRIRIYVLLRDSEWPWTLFQQMISVRIEVIEQQEKNSRSLRISLAKPLISDERSM